MPRTIKNCQVILSQASQDLSDVESFNTAVSRSSLLNGKSNGVKSASKERRSRGRPKKVDEASSQTDSEEKVDSEAETWDGEDSKSSQLNGKSNGVKSPSKDRRSRGRPTKVDEASSQSDIEEKVESEADTWDREDSKGSQSNGKTNSVKTPSKGRQSRGRPKKSASTEAGTSEHKVDSEAETCDTETEDTKDTSENAKKSKALKRKSAGGSVSSSSKGKQSAGKQGEKKPKKESDKGSDSEESTDGKDYEVARILEVHFRRDGTREFLVRWKGFKEEDDTWEPEAHLNCADLVHKFMQKVDKAKNATPRAETKRRVREKPQATVVPTHHKQGLRYKGYRPFYQE